MPLLRENCQPLTALISLESSLTAVRVNLQKMLNHTYSVLSMSAVGRKHKENQDRALARTIPWTPTPLYLLVVADGISSCVYGGSVARFIVERHLAVDEIFHPEGQPIGDQLKDYLVALNKSFHNEFSDMEEMQASGASLSVAVVCGDVADCFWVGDSPIYISRQIPTGFESELILIPDKDGNALTDHFGGAAPFNLTHRHLTLAVGDILTITSDGVVHDSDLLSRSYARIGFNQAFLNEVKDRANRSPVSDDISLVACKRVH